MLYKMQYTDDTERESIILSNTDKSLIEERNIKDGNFLIFTDEIIKESEFSVLKTDVSAIAETTANVLEDNTATAETLATALIEIENLKAEVTTLKGV